ncbi:MAG: DUF192 domain-containing protein [Christensenellales bacterium]
MKVKIYSRDKLLWDNIEVADNFFSRLKGLLGKRGLTEGEGLLITNCSQVHTVHMRFPLDLLYITKKMRVARIITLNPGKVGPKVKEAAYVLEVAAKSAEENNVSAGDYITIK